MGQTVTAVQSPQAIGRLDGHTNFATLEYIVANGVTINEGDFVKFDGVVGVTNASMTGDSRPLGMALGTATGNAAGTVTVLVCVDPMMRYLIKSSSTNFATTARGSYFDLANANQISNSASTTTGAFILLALGSDTVPNANQTGIQGANTAAFGVFKLVESALNPLGS